MGQKQIKTARRAAEKTAKVMALELAKAQLIEIVNAPFKIRWQFCKAILFPKKLRVSAGQKAKIQKTAHGGMNEQFQKEGEIARNKDGSMKFGLVHNDCI
jgi:hypothetical protein